MKQYAILKTGYTSGIYGNSGEYFVCVFFNSKGLKSFKFNGQYGVEERIGQMMKENGYEEKYLQSDYGKMTRKDIMKNNYSEYQVRDNIKELITKGYIEKE